MSACRYDITFAGRVQGVGFRYTTVRVAGGFDVTGWVRNQPDGTVHCVAEGSREELDRFVQAIQQQMEGSISDTKIAPADATGEFSGFTIR